MSSLITIIVMASVFTLLSRAQRSFEREPEIADLQQSARSVLDMVSRDILQAGSGLPPEFPAFSRINGAGDGATTDVLEVFGMFHQSGNLYLDPELVAGFLGNDVQMNANTTNFQVGDMVIVYNDAPNNGLTPQPPQWVLADVTDIVEDPLNPIVQALVTLDYGVYDSQYSNYPFDGAPNPPTQANFFAGDGRLPLMTRVAVVRYFTVTDDPATYSGPPPEILMRDMDFAGVPQEVGYLENFQITYMIGSIGQVEQQNPPNPVVDLAGLALTAENMLSGVRVSLTARSITAGMEGSSEGAMGPDDDFVRKAFSTSVNPRNVSAALEARVLSELMQ